MAWFSIQITLMRIYSKEFNAGEYSVNTDDSFDNDAD